MQCIRVHRARRGLRCAAALIVLGGSARKASAQCPTYPQQPAYAGFPAALAEPGLPTSTGVVTLPVFGAVLQAMRVLIK